MGEFPEHGAGEAARRFLLRGARGRGGRRGGVGARNSADAMAAFGGPTTETPSPITDGQCASKSRS